MRYEPRRTPRPANRAASWLAALAIAAPFSFSGLFNAAAAFSQTPIFFNEIHYDNTGTDTGEAIEIAGPAGTDLTGWTIVLYNGADGASYNTTALSGTIPDLGGGFGVVFVSYPVNGIQNGAPDGLALVDNLGAVVQFLSYEGSFTAVGGPADGLTSTDIGVSESSTTPIGESLQLGGTGSTYEDFAWNPAAPGTFGAFNTGQTFSAADAAPFVALTAPASGAANVAIDATISISFSEAVDVTGTWFEITGSSSGAHTATVSGGPVSFNLDPDIDFANNETVTVTLFAANVTDQDSQDPPDNMTGDFSFDFSVISSDLAPSVTGFSPAEGATGIAVAVNLVITFDEPVNVSGTWFSITGSNSGGHTALVTGGPESFTLDPDADFSAVETVTVTVFAANVTDLDGDDPPDNMAADFSFSFSTAGLLINEILADPDAINGDANNDGVVNTTQDEFVELVNTAGYTIDLSGWTLSDGFGVRHTFPAGTTVDDLCAIVIFAGGAPAGAFGNATVQVASSGQLGLNNAGDTVTLKNGATPIATYTYGAEGGDNQSLTRDPDLTGPPPLVKHTLAAGAAGRLFSPGTLVDGSQFPGCPPLLTLKEIYEIQGSGLASPFAGQTVTTEKNVVTALRPDGFFMQTPAARTDGDEQTSDGIFVFTGSPPAVSVGDEVDVTGTVVEFFDFTEFNNAPAVSLLSSGNALPPAVILDATTPSPSQPQPATELERFEGMLVSITGGAVAGGNQAFGSDPLAEVFIVAGPDRPFREPGIAFPGISGLPVWDGNPEIFELDPDRLGLPNQAIAAGSSFDAAGVLGFEFGGYELWPTSLSITPVAMPRAVPAPDAGEATVATFNVHQFYDDVDDPNNDIVRTAQQYADKQAKLSLYIRSLLHSPDIVAVQEAENLKTLQDLAARISSDDPAIMYTPYLVEGNDVSGIDVGFLVRNGVAVQAVTQLGATETLSVDGSLLHDRPPLLLEATLNNGCTLSVLAVHMRSLNGIDDPAGGSRVRQKRHEQAVSIATMVQNLQTAHPNGNLIVTGDFNAFQFSDGYVHVLGQIAGTPAGAGQALVPGTDLVEPDLANIVLSLPPGEQYSFTFQGNAQALDHMLVSQNLGPAVSGIAYARGNADVAVNFENDPSTALRTSDHDGLVLYLRPNTVVAEAGNDRTVCAGVPVDLGGVPTASGGTAPYTFAWSPAGDFADATVANPIARPTGSTTYTVTVTDANGCTATDQVAVTVLDFVFLAQEHVKIDGTKNSAGDIHSNGRIEFGGARHGQHNGDLTAVGDIVIKSGNTINGDAIAGGELRLEGHATVSGTTAEHAGVGAVSLPSLSFAAGDSNVTVEKRESVILTPGRYGKVKVESKGTLILTAGFYYMNIFDTDDRASLICDASDGPITLNAVEELEFDAKVEVTVLPDGESGTSMVSFNTQQIRTVDIGEHSKILGSINAPAAEVHFSEKSAFKGSVCANKITVEEGVAFRPHSASAGLPKAEPEAPAGFAAADSSAAPATPGDNRPAGYELRQNYPNPFNPTTMISFSLPQAGYVVLDIYATNGRLVRRLVAGEMNAGRYSVLWDAKDEHGARVASGLYLYVLRAGAFTDRRKLILLK